MTVLEFSRKHWAAASALFIATSLAIATGTIIFLYPGAVLAIAGFTLSDAMPLAFIGPMSLPAAITTISALVFSINLILSTLFNVIVAIYNAIDHFFRPLHVDLADGFDKEVIGLLSEHWAVASALLIATAFSIAIAMATFLYPPVILAIAGFTVFDATPLAFIGPMPLPAAVLTVTALVFSINLVASILFNTVVSIYNALDRLLQPEPPGPPLTPSSHKNMRVSGLEKRPDGDHPPFRSDIGDDINFSSPLTPVTRGIVVEGRSHQAEGRVVVSPKNSCY